MNINHNKNNNIMRQKIYNQQQQYINPSFHPYIHQNNDYNDGSNFDINNLNNEDNINKPETDNEKKFKSKLYFNLTNENDEDDKLHYILQNIEEIMEMDRVDILPILLIIKSLNLKEYTDLLLDKFCENNRIDLLESMRDMGINLCRLSILYKATYVGNLEILKFLNNECFDDIHNIKKKSNDKIYDDIIDACIINDSVKCLEFLTEHNFYLDDITFDIAKKYDSPKCIEFLQQYLKENKKKQQKLII